MKTPNTAVIKKLSDSDAKEFGRLEEVCKLGRLTFFVVGQALQKIKLFKFYESKGFKSFESYADSIGYSRSHAYRLMKDKDAVGSLPEAMRPLVMEEKAAHELAKIPEAIRVAIVTELSEGGKKHVAAEQIKKAIPPRPKPAPAKKPTPPPRSKEPHKHVAPPKKKGPTDFTGVEIPAEILPLWNRGSEVQELLMHVSVVKSALARARDHEDLLFAPVNFNSALAHCEQLYADAKSAKPFAVCPTCGGTTAKTCTACVGRGFVSEFYWNQCVPEETRKLRKKS